MTETPPCVHIYFLLDRSGSMQDIASDVIGGFNAFLSAQQANGPDALLTLVQFDSQDCHEVLVDGAEIRSVARLTASSFVPRGGTPLYDAMGHTIADAAIRVESRRANGQPDEEILFFTFTDGLENQSWEYTRAAIFELIEKRQAQGWSFAYLGANQDAYDEGGHIGYSAASIQNFRADAPGTAAAFASSSTAILRRRNKIRAGGVYENTDLFEDHKGAEADLDRRSK
ncbi:MAG: VWA domain-containing protein [Actinomycetota bacterium]